MSAGCGTLNMKPCLSIWPVTSLSANTNHALIPWISSFCGLTWREIGRHAQWSLRLPQSGQLSQTVQAGGTERLGSPTRHTVLEKQQRNKLTPTHRRLERNQNVSKLWLLVGDHHRQTTTRRTWSQVYLQWIKVKESRVKRWMKYSFQ